MKVTTKNSPKTDGDISTKRKKAPPRTIEDAENENIGLALRLAQKQLAEGTASAQVITHYLKLGSTKERLEREILEKQRDLYAAKTDAIQSAKSSEETYANALVAFREYTGESDEDDE